MQVLQRCSIQPSPLPLPPSSTYRYHDTEQSAFLPAMQSMWPASFCAAMMAMPSCCPLAPWSVFRCHQNASHSYTRIVQAKLLPGHIVIVRRQSDGARFHRTNAAFLLLIDFILLRCHDNITLHDQHYRTQFPLQWYLCMTNATAHRYHDNSTCT